MAGLLDGSVVDEERAKPTWTLAGRAHPRRIARLRRQAGALADHPALSRRAPQRMAGLLDASVLDEERATPPWTPARRAHPRRIARLRPQAGALADHPALNRKVSSVNVLSAKRSFRSPT